MKKAYLNAVACPLPPRLVPLFPPPQDTERTGVCKLMRLVVFDSFVPHPLYGSVTSEGPSGIPALFSPLSPPPQDVVGVGGGMKRGVYNLSQPKGRLHRFKIEQFEILHCKILVGQCRAK
jgi:hypothetical protein